MVEPAEEKHVDAPDAHPSLISRTRVRVAALETRGKRLAERADAERVRHSSVDATFEIVDHDAEVGGGIMAGALAYRLFIWLLSFALVAVAGLGIEAEAASTSPESAAKSLGLAGLVSASVSSAAKSSAHWYAFFIGIPVLLFTTRSVLRAMIVIHRLVWRDARGMAPKPTLRATVRFLAILLGYFVITVLITAVRARSGGIGLLALLLSPVPYAALWVFVSVRLPPRNATWRTHVPGALVFGFGIVVLHAVTAYFIAPQASSKQGTYGSLGLAAALLLGLFLFARLAVASAVVSATLSARRSRAG